MSDRDDDPTLVRNQPALRTATGRSWLVMGGLLMAVSLSVLFPMLSLGYPAVTWMGIVSTVILYLAMIATRLAVPPGRRRLGILATCMGAIAAVTLICVAIVASTEWSSLTGID